MTVLLTPGAASTSTGSTLMTLGRPVGRSLSAGGWPPEFPPSSSCLMQMGRVTTGGRGGNPGGGRRLLSYVTRCLYSCNENWGGETYHNVNTLWKCWKYMYFVKPMGAKVLTASRGGRSEEGCWDLIHTSSCLGLASAPQNCRCWRACALWMASPATSRQHWNNNWGGE